ncbi:MAG: S8 family peptidase [Muribaculaceae bacterium]|nr:S8 family peptidase [Muribaculaceae bacterium]
MKRRSLFLFLTILITLTAGAQVQLRVSDRLKINGLDKPLQPTAAKALASDQTARAVELIVRYSGDEALSAIEAAGGEIISLVGTHTAIVSTTADAVDAIAACKSVTGVKLSEVVKPSNKEARVASRVDDVLAGNDLPAAFDGSGVVVGMYDTGIDPNHINFRADDGNSRISNLWHYDGKSSVATVYDTPSAIAGFDTDYSDSHGTHVLGVIGGSFVDKVNGGPDYRGMAPGAELAVAAGLGYNAQILDGIERIAKHASDQGKPCVVNISFGNNLGPHDGSDEFTEAINDIADKYNAIICMAAGNERDQDISLIKEFTDDDNELKTLLVKGSADVDAFFQSFGTIDIYTEDDTPFEVYLEIINRSTPDDIQYSLQIPENEETYLTQGGMIEQFIDNTSSMNLISDGTPFQTVYYDSFAGGICEVDPHNNRYHASLSIYLQGRSSTYASRYFILLRVKGQPGKKIFAYCDGTYMNFGTKNIAGFDKPNGNGTNSNMGSGKSTIAVGSYVTANVEGSPYNYGTIGELSWFSSFGETPDGRIMPEICAPGQVIISSRNSYLDETGNAIFLYPIHYSYTDPKSNKTYNWTSCAGTSQASPHVAGVVALWLQANPDLSIADVKEIMARTAAAPTSDQDGWGGGRLDAYAGIKEAIAKSGVANVSIAHEAVVLNRDGNTFEAFVPGANAVTAEVYDMSGTLVKRASSSNGTIRVDADGLAHGIYVLRVSADIATKSFKISL